MLSSYVFHSVIDASFELLKLKVGPQPTYSSLPKELSLERKMEENLRKVKKGALVLKGEKKKKHKKKHKRDRSGERGEEAGSSKRSKKEGKSDFARDMEAHDGWWAAENYYQIVGPVALQFNNGAYMKALDNGKFILGAPHGEGEGPDPEEILMAMRVGENKISLKSGFDKYLRIDKSARMVGVSDAVGVMEMFEPVWEEGKMAMLGHNGRFMSTDEEDYIIFDKDKVSPTEIIRLRSNRIRDDMKEKEIPEELRGNLSQVEEKMVRKYQKFIDHKLKISQNGVAELIEAKRGGNLHEKLLDRREKMKSDRMCK